MTLKKAKKVLILVENLPVPKDKRVWKEAQSLSRAGFRVTVICPKGEGCRKSVEIIENIHIYRHPLILEARSGFGYLFEYGVSFVYEFALSIKILLRHGFDVIQACTPPDLLFIIGFIYKLLFRKKFLYDHHDGNPDIWLAKKGTRDFVYHILVFLERLTFRVADASFAVNESYVEIAVSRGKMSRDKISIVRNAPSKTELERVSISEKVESIKRGKKYMVGYLGVMGKQDGIEYLLDAFRYIIYEREFHDVILAMMGEGPERKYLTKYANNLGLHEFIEFPGWVSGKRYYEYMQTCDVCVNSDVVNEYNEKCSPNKVFEYMMFSKPIVQFAMIENKKLADGAALYASANNSSSLGEKILELLNDCEKRRSMGEIGKQRIIDEFLWEYSEKEMLKRYSSLFIDRRHV